MEYQLVEPGTPSTELPRPPQETRPIRFNAHATPIGGQSGHYVIQVEREGIRGLCHGTPAHEARSGRFPALDFHVRWQQLRAIECEHTGFITRVWLHLKDQVDAHDLQLYGTVEQNVAVFRMLESQPQARSLFQLKLESVGGVMRGWIYLPGGMAAFFLAGGYFTYQDLLTLEREGGQRRIHWLMAALYHVMGPKSVLFVCIPIGLLFLLLGLWPVFGLLSFKRRWRQSGAVRKGSR